MTAGNVWYQMRPNKFVDRRMFVELLAQSVPVIGAGKYIYVSMGGSHLVDHHSVYRHVGIRSLFSFDKDDAPVRRQEVNGPVDSFVCQKMESNELPSEIPALFELFDGTTNLVVWLDYTSTQRFQQLSEFESVLGDMDVGDICRITLNSDVRNIGGGGDRWKRDGFDSPGSFRASQLRNNLGHYYDSNIKAVPEDGVPFALSHAVRIAASRAALRATNLRFIPMLLTTYKDAQRIFTATIYAAEKTHIPSTIANWEFRPDSWDDVLDIDVPELSVREKILIDETLSRSAHDILREIDFVPAQDEAEAVRALDSYKRLHRFVPTFQHIDY